ncbi:MAG TPA: LamG domain-containing protein [bacterium]|nr:LamG domain-containing protein [bacterium]HPN45564.1 LamG domain-containing protein [bacterium]
MKKNVLILLTLTCMGCSKKDPSLVAWWNFDSVNSGIVKDMSGNGLDAVSRNATFGKGKSGQAFYGDGKGYLEVKYTPAMNDFKNGITLSVWIFRDRNSNKVYNCVVTREVRDTWSEYFDIAVVNNKPLFAIDADGANYQQAEGPDSIPLNKWIHLTGTFDNKTMRLYINGKESATLPYEKPFTFSDKNPLIIGSNTNDQGKIMHDFFYGYIDDLKIFNRSLSAEEIMELAK